MFPQGRCCAATGDGQILGSGSDVSKYWAERRAGNIDLQAWTQIEDGIARSAGTCMTMGTASTMTSLAEVLGFSLPGASSIPAVDSNHPKMANRSGRRIVEMVWEDLKPRDILRDASFNNAIAAVFALGGSTNAVIHLLALAGRAGNQAHDATASISFPEKRPCWPICVRAARYLMEDFYYAGGLPALLRALSPHLDLELPDHHGKNARRKYRGRGNLQSGRDSQLGSIPFSHLEDWRFCTEISRRTAPSSRPQRPNRRLLKHTGRAIVFDSFDEMNARIDDPALDVDANSVSGAAQRRPKRRAQECPNGATCPSRKNF